MGKKKGKRVDLEKKAALQAKKEAKANKAAHKRLSKEARTLGEDDRQVTSNSLTGAQPAEALDDLLEKYRIQDASATSSHMETIEGFPPPRANATLTLTEDTKKKKAEFYLFGGEYYDGAENIVLNQLYRYDINKNEWKLIVTPPPHPPSRCAHTTVYYNNSLYVFGGEMATTDEYHHYKDLWKYDIKQQVWVELSAGGKKSIGTTPSARSGHAAVVWKHFLVIFGGFYEALRDTPRWYNDVTVFDLQTEQWLDVPHSKLSVRPEPRSACNVAVIQDKMIVHGGFSKLDKKSTPQQSQEIVGKDGLVAQAETKVHTDAWMLHLKPLLSGKPPTWERSTSSLPKSQLPGLEAGTKSMKYLRHPGGRSGTGCVAYKDRMLVYGGVVDREQLHHKVDSVFYNDLFGFDIERRKWFPIHLKKTTSIHHGKVKESNVAEKREAADAESEGDSVSDLEQDGEEDNDPQHANEHEGWDLERLRTNMFAFVDGSGNIIYERIEEEEEKAPELEESEDEEEEEKEESKEDEEEIEATQPQVEIANSEEKEPTALASSSVMELDPQTKTPKAVERSDPLPRIKSSLVVCGHTLYVYGGLLEVGDREITLDDLWAFDLRKRNEWTCIFAGTVHKQVWKGAVHDDDDSYVSSTGNSAAVDDIESDESDSADEDTTDGLKDAKKKSKRSDLRQEIPELNEKYELSDSNRTPEASEALADFYARTSDYWNSEAAKHVSEDSDPLSQKELKREGFKLAQQRFEELSPVLERLRDLDLRGKEKKDKKSKKKEKSKKR